MMGNFKIITTNIEGLFVIESKAFSDGRGYFMETWNKRAFEEMGLFANFVQDNQSKSTKNVLRGLHFQKKNPQGKLVRVISGEVYDVAVDLREKSSSFGQWFGIFLSAENKKQMWIPEGFAHGFLVTSETAVFCYKCTRFYDAEDEDGLLWNDPALGIEWPLKNGEEAILSDKDRHYPKMNERRFSYADIE